MKILQNFVAFSEYMTFTKGSHSVLPELEIQEMFYFFLYEFSVTKCSTDLTTLKFIYSEKATKFCKIFTLLLSCVVPVKSKANISQNFVVFSEYMNFNKIPLEVRLEPPIGKPYGLANTTL